MSDVPCWTIRVTPRGESFDGVGELLVACENREDLHDDLCDALWTYVSAYRYTSALSDILLPGMDWDALKAFPIPEQPRDGGLDPALKGLWPPVENVGRVQERRPMPQPDLSDEIEEVLSAAELRVELAAVRNRLAEVTQQRDDLRIIATEAADKIETHCNIGESEPGLCRIATALRARIAGVGGLMMWDFEMDPGELVRMFDELEKAESKPSANPECGGCGESGLLENPDDGCACPSAGEVTSG